jgi:ribonuclease Z
MNRFVVIGSSNAVPKIDQENAYLYVESNTRKILVDCGDNPIAGLSRIHVDLTQITDLVLTHFHPDHAGSLPLLIMGMWLEKRKNPLIIHGLEFTLDRAKALLGLFGWMDWKDLFQVTFNTIKDSGNSLLVSEGDLLVSASPVQHLIPTVGLRFEFKKLKTIVYSSDSEPCENLARLADGADVLLQEAAGSSKGHTSPEQAGQIASRAKVRQLILIHYEARNGKETLLNTARSTFSGDVKLAIDGLEVV